MANKTVLIGTPRKDGAGTPAHEEWTTGDTPVDPDGNPLGGAAGVDNFLLWSPFGGSGVDGARHDVVNGTLNPGASKQFTSWTIDAGVSFTLFGQGVHRIGVQGLFDCSGLLQVSQHLAGGAGGAGLGAGGNGNPGVTASGCGRGVGTLTPTGGGGGGGGSGVCAVSGGAGGLGGTYLGSPGGAAGTGAVHPAAGTVGGTGSATYINVPRWASSLANLYFATGGGGGGGGGRCETFSGGGGHGGFGGALLIVECGSFRLPATGEMRANGGGGVAGTNAGAANAGGGGGGGGGGAGTILVLTKQVISDAGIFTCNGGAGGAAGVSSGGCPAPGPGGPGGAGYGSYWLLA